MNKVKNPLPYLFIIILIINIVTYNKLNMHFYVLENIIGLIFFTSLALEKTHLIDNKKNNIINLISGITFILLQVFEVIYM